MNQISFKDKKVTVMGIGLHGGAVAMIKWLNQQGAKVIATDMKNAQELAPSLEKLKGLKNLTVVTGQHRMEDFEHVDMVIKNPSVNWENKYIRAAMKKNIPVQMDSSLFFQLCPSTKTIGVTGTKGKTTTSLLIVEILKAAGKKVVPVGIGQEAVMDKLSQIDKDTFVVFELSSWRLSALGHNKLSPHIAVVTNLYQDHLNYYSSMSDYIADKRFILENQKKNDFAVLNFDNEITKNRLNLSGELKSQATYFSKEKFDDKLCVYVENGNINFNRDGQLGTIALIKDIRLRGKHNLGNILAACLVGVILQIEPKIIQKAVTQFQGASHRLEWVKTINAVDFYNDTAATTPESAMMAIDSFSQSIILISGGSNKNLDLSELAEKISQTQLVKKVFLLQGAVTEKLKSLIEQAGGAEKIEGIFHSLNEVVVAAYKTAEKGDVVLLSPGCASFGMFVNEFDRGDKFKQAVEKLG